MPAARRRVPGWLGWVAGTALLVVLTWPPSVQLPSVGLDPSWVAGLGMAWRDHLDFGSQLLFTYGPLGFLEHPALYDTSAYRLATLYELVIGFAEAFVIWRAASVTWGRGWAWLIALLVMCVAATVEGRVVIAVGVCVLLLTDQRLRPRMWWVVVLGAWAGFELLGKQGTALIVPGVLFVALAFMTTPGTRARRLGVFIAASAAGFLGGWFLAGQSGGALPEFIHSAIQFLQGYSASMSTDDPTAHRTYWGALVVVIALVIGLRTIGRDSVRRGIGGLAAVSALATFLMFKQGFVRMDAGHLTLFFGFIVALVVLLPWGPARRMQAFLTLLLALAVLFGSNGVDPASVVNPRSSPSDFRQSIRLTFRGAERQTLAEAGRRTMLDTYKIQPSVFAALSGHGVHVVPWEAGVVWAERLRWDPLPVFQNYAAYTTWLDDRNADEIAAGRGPDRILQAPAQAIDGRLPGWDPPSQNVEQLCSYRPIVQQPEWRVLARGPQRCGPARKVATVTAKLGEAIKVPAVARDELLVVHVNGLEVSGLEKIRALAFKPRDRWSIVDGRIVRVMPGTAQDGLLLRAPVTVDPPGPFQLSPQARTLSFWVGKAGSGQSGRELQLDFEARRVS